MPKLPNLLFLPFERQVKYLKLGSSFPSPFFESPLLDKHLLLFSSNQNYITNGFTSLALDLCQHKLIKSRKFVSLKRSKQQVNGFRFRSILLAFFIITKLARLIE
tara:strand:+ start:177 stop:491 length:315 start_codon:yes stop_codon:yes gene_type:complete